MEDGPDHRVKYLMRMHAGEALPFVSAVKRAMPTGQPWAHSFLYDLKRQLSDGYRGNLSRKQAAIVLGFADRCGVQLQINSREKLNA